MTRPELSWVASPASLQYQPSLDGLRGVAIAVVVGYHLGVPWLGGGFLGVSLFFTLSGYLITNLLLADHDRTGTVRLGAFWGRRARRLLPAALAAIVLAVAVAGIAGDASQLSGLRGDVLASVTDVANWRFVFDHTAYQAGYLAPSPLLHFWSLAVEEQLYLGLPVLILVVTKTGRTRSGSVRGRLGMLTVGLLVASALATVAAGLSGGPNRVYFGTDTRAFEVLAGVLLACTFGFPEPKLTKGRRRKVVDGAGVMTLVMAAGLWTLVSDGDRWLYRGGLWAVATLSCALVVVSVIGGVASTALRCRPFVALGRVSYGVYLYHWPLFLLLDGRRTGLAPIPLIAVRIGATVAVAAASYRYLEQPIRQRRWAAKKPVKAMVMSLLGVVVAATVVAQGSARRAVASERSHRVVLASGDGVLITAPAVASGPRLRRVLFLGDSLVQESFPTLAARLRARGAQAAVIGGGGQSLMWHRAAWLGELRQSVAAFDPDVVVLESCCGNFMIDPPWTGPDGRVVTADTPAFWSQWRQLASAASVIASSRGAAVLWALGPPTDTNGWYGPIDGRIPTVNKIYQSLVACAPGAGVVDWRVLGGSGGTYAAVLPDDTGRPVQIRNADGFHFTPPGIDVQAAVTLADIVRHWSAHGGRPGPWPSDCR